MNHVFLSSKCYSLGSCKVRCQTFSKHFSSPQQQPLESLPSSFPLVSFLAALLIARKSWGPQLPVFLSSHAPWVLVIYKYFLGWGIPWMTNCSGACGYVGAIAHSPQTRWVPSSSLGSETGCHMTQVNCFTMLCFCLHTGVASKNGGEEKGHLPLSL